MVRRQVTSHRLRLYVFQCDYCPMFEAHGPRLRAVCIAGKVHLKIKHGKDGEMEVWEKDLLTADAMFNAHAKVCRTCSGDGPECCEIGDKLLILINDALNTGLYFEDKAREGTAKTSIPKYWMQRMANA